MPETTAEMVTTVWVANTEGTVTVRVTLENFMKLTVWVADGSLAALNNLSLLRSKKALTVTVTAPDSEVA
jgi:hypothetical protein